MDIGEFTGRAEDLARLTSMIDGFESGVPVVSIEGMAGVGKTRFAVHAARRLVSAGRFEQVQLWADLHGFDPGQRSAAPADVLEGFLRLLGVPGTAIPHDLEERAALYRDRLAGRRGLVLLDNAATADQVRPLLPGDPAALVLITSRHRMPGLAGARRLPLEVLNPDEAVALLGRIAGAERVSAEPDAARRVARLSGHLPLLLALAARRLHARPAWKVTDLAGLIEARGHSVVEPVDDVSRTVWSSLELSYRGLAEHQQHLLRCLGAHPGPDFTARSAAAVSGYSVPDAETVLEQLLDEHLVQQEVTGRYRFHDLIRRYVREVAVHDEPAGRRDEAQRRCLTWYLHAADAAVQALEPHRRRTFDLDGAQPVDVQPQFVSDAAALAWCDHERANLVAAVHAAAAADLPEIAWQLPAVLLRYFYRRSHWADWLDTHEVALASVRGSGDLRGEATVLNGLSVAYGDLHRFDASAEHGSRAAALFADAGDDWGRAWSLNNLGVTSIERGDPSAAVDQLRTSLTLFRDVGDPQGLATCLNNLADGYRLLGSSSEAIACLQEAIELQSATDPTGRRYPLGTLGDVYRSTGRYDEAVSHYEQALPLHRVAGDLRGAGRLLRSLGETLAAGGRVEAARRRLREARTVLTEIGAPEAETIALPPPSLDDRQRLLVERMEAYIDAHLDAQELSPATIAAAHHISLRYLYKLFRARETTVAAWIRQRRLEHCRRDLADPGLADRPVAAVAARWGFVNPAHFTRAFRAEYGLTPGEYRRAHDTRSAGTGNSSAHSGNRDPR